MKRVFNAIVAVIIVVLYFPAPAAAGQFEDGRAAYVRGHYATALWLLRPLAYQGDARAQTILGLMYDQGRGVPKEFAVAAKWYRVAADQGEATAQIYVGLMYTGRDGAPEDYVLAYMWFNLSAAQGSRIAAWNRDAAVQHMFPWQIAWAQELSREWRPTRHPTQ
jgi:uncharacterized protein